MKEFIGDPKRMPTVFRKADPIELGMNGSLTWQQINSGQVQFGIQEHATVRATVVCDFNQIIKLIKSLADIVGVRTHYETPRGIIKP